MREELQRRLEMLLQREEVVSLLHHEARLLDERRFDEWLQLLTDDVVYLMAVRNTLYTTDSRAITLLEGSASKQSEPLVFLEEDKSSLAMRIARLQTGMAWAEEPASRTRRLVSNIEVGAGQAASELKLCSNFAVYRNRLETDSDLYVGRREDVVRHVDGAWRIARRNIVFDQNVILAKNFVGLF